MTLTELAGRTREWAGTPMARRLGRVARVAFFVSMIGVLAFQLRAIGWRDVARSLPTQPLFYILFLVNFLVLPVSEVPIFRMLLGRTLPGALPVLVRKRIINSVLVDYSGDLYFYGWARGRLGIDARRVLLAVKDNAILSSLAGAMVAAGFVLLFIARAPAGRIAGWLDSAAGLILAVVLGLSLLAPLLLRFRSRILSVSAGIAWRVLGVHVARTFANLLIQVAAWAIVLPQEHWTVWLSFLTAQLVISRLPFVPNRDLLFAAVGLEMSGALASSTEGMAALLIAGGALTQGMNLLFFVITAFDRRRGVLPAESEPAGNDGDDLASRP